MPELRIMAHPLLGAHSWPKNCKRPEKSFWDIGAPERGDAILYIYINVYAHKTLGYLRFSDQS